MIQRELIMTHPYRNYPSRQFWGKAVSRGYDPGKVATFPAPLITADDKVVTAGSCFAANLVPFLEEAGFHYLRTEFTHPIYKKVPAENLSYGKFSAGYGNIYTARQMYQLLLRALGEFRPIENCWLQDDRFVDPFRPGLAFKARSKPEFELIGLSHLQATRRAFAECSVFIFTLGLTEAWISKPDGAVFPACPGTIAGEFDPDRHTFTNFTVNDVVGDLRNLITRFRELNPSVRIILTVSPVPLVATAEPKHVLSATVYSKSVLRVAAEMASQEFESVSYFPAYELVTGPQAPYNFFEDDRRNVSSQAVKAVMDSFLSACKPLETQASKPQLRANGNSAADKLSAALSSLECEEAAQAL